MCSFQQMFFAIVAVVLFCSPLDSAKEVNNSFGNKRAAAYDTVTGIPRKHAFKEGGDDVTTPHKLNTDGYAEQRIPNKKSEQFENAFDFGLEVDHAYDDEIATSTYIRIRATAAQEDIPAATLSRDPAEKPGAAKEEPTSIGSPLDAPEISFREENATSAGSSSSVSFFATTEETEIVFVVTSQEESSSESTTPANNTPAGSATSEDSPTEEKNTMTTSSSSTELSSAQLIKMTKDPPPTSNTSGSTTADSSAIIEGVFSINTTRNEHTNESQMSDTSPAGGAKTTEIPVIITTVLVGNDGNTSTSAGNDDGSGFPWWIIIPVAVAVAVVIVVLTVLILLWKTKNSKRNKKGEEKKKNPSVAVEKGDIPPARREAAPIVSSLAPVVKELALGRKSAEEKRHEKLHMATARENETVLRPPTEGDTVSTDTAGESISRQVAEETTTPEKSTTTEELKEENKQRKHEENTTDAGNSVGDGREAETTVQRVKYHDGPWVEVNQLVDDFSFEISSTERE